MHDCKPANPVFENTEEFKKHMLEMHYCDSCNMQMERMTQHYREKHGECIYCDAENVTYDHRFRCYFCKLCNGEIDECKTMQEHYKEKHNKLICLDCLNAFNNRESYNDHKAKCNSSASSTL
jgi:alpha-L-fucosidase